MNTTIARLHNMLRMTIRKVRRFSARILKKDIKITRLRLIIIASIVFSVVGLILWPIRPVIVLGAIGSVLVGSIVIGLLACFALRIKGLKDRMITIGSVVLCAFGLIFIGGMDCEPPKDDDLLIPEVTNNVPACENAFVAITNLAHKVYDEDGDCERESDAMCMADLLYFYVDPKENNLCLCYGGVNLGDFMDRQRIAETIEAALASNKTLLAIYDNAASRESFSPPSIKECNFSSDVDYPLADLIQFSRMVLPARTKLAAQKGDVARAVSLFKKDVEFAQRMSENPGRLIDHLVARAMMSLAAWEMARTVREYDFPDMELQKVNDIIASASQDNKLHFIHALKREYMVVRHNIKSSDVLDRLGWNSDNFISRALVRFVARYAFQPNKTRSRVVDAIRGEIDKVTADKVPSQKRRQCRTCRKAPWYSVLLPNGFGGIKPCEYNGHAESCLRKIPLQLLAARVQIAVMRYSRKHGREARSIDDLAAFLGDYPQSLLGEPVEIDLKGRKVKCGEHSENIETERIRYFPFIKKDGRIMTNDGKTVMALENVEELSTDELDSHADYIDYDGIKTLIVGNSYTNESWGIGIFRLCPSLLTESEKLHEVVVPSNHSVYAVSDGVVYLKNYGCMIRCLAGRELVEVPVCIKEVTPRAFQYCPGLKTIVFNGPLPRIYRREDGVARKLSDKWDRFIYWCRYRTKRNWKRIFKSYRPKPLLSNTAKECVTIVMDETADARTQEFVKKGEWEGRKIVTRPR